MKYQPVSRKSLQNPQAPHKLFGFSLLNLLICMVVFADCKNNNSDEDFLSVTSTELAFGAGDNTSKTLSVQTNAKNWTATPSENWIYANPAGKDKLTVSVKNYTGKTNRTGSITVTAGSATPVTVTVTQSLASTMLSVSLSTLLFFEIGEAAAQSVTVTTNFGSWDYTCDEQWLSIRKSDNQLTVAVHEITVGSSSREATITIIAGDETADIQVTQLEPEQLPATGEIPIMGYCGVIEEETSVERFLEMKEAGININYSFYSGIEALKRALDAAQQAGVKMLAACPDIKTKPETTVNQLKNHPALFGYYVYDEPMPPTFKELGNLTRRIQTVDEEHPCYINLLPNGATAQYDYATDYVGDFLKEVPVKMLSFDHYPIVRGSTNVRSGWYQNLEIIARASQKAEIPFWAFAMVTAHNDYPVPTVGEIKLQMFSNLAYGAQGLQYFTYFTPVGEGADFFYYDGPIDADLKPTEVYYRIQAINREIQNYAGVFLGAKLVFVAHTGTSIPVATRRLSSNQLPKPFKQLQIYGGAVVSVLENGDNRFLVIVNRDFQKTMVMTVQTDDTVKKVLKDGTLRPANIYSPTLQVDPGDVVIYTWKE